MNKSREFIEQRSDDSFDIEDCSHEFTYVRVQGLFGAYDLNICKRCGEKRK